MPKLGADMSAGTLVEWRKQPGDAVRRGDIVAAVETDNGVIDVEIFNSGVIEKLLVGPGERAPVGASLALIRDDITSEATVDRPKETTPAAAAASSATPPAPSASSRAAAWSMEDIARLRISPSARQLARELGVDPRAVTGTGPKGAITREDIQRAADQERLAPAAQPAPTVPKQVRMRQVIAAAMPRSKREIPHDYVSTTIDLHRATVWLADQNAQRALADRLLMGVLLLKASALAL